MGFNLVGYGCTTCIGNSGELREDILEVVNKDKEMVYASILSGNRNYEGRVGPYTKANYLCAPVYVVAYALVGRIDFDFKTESMGKD